jgi:cytosine/adenosine deaminase-related metal-dependent hydrolase
VVVEGTVGTLLRGVVLLPDGVLDPGEVLIAGNTIACVAADCSSAPGADAATVVDTGGVISPGLVDAHNHLPYDFLPEWVPDPMRLFGNRYEWADDPGYEEHIRPYTAHRSTGTHYCPAAKWGELRAIVHGATLVQGQSLRQSCINRLARNADHYHSLGYDHIQTSIASPRDITDADAMAYVAQFTDETEPTTRLAVHMVEGVSGSNIELEFGSFAGRDSRDNRHAGTSLLAAADGSYGETGLLIHAMSLTDAELLEAADTGASIVWSPSSNIVLYGATAPIARILELGITVGLGPDWTLSGEDEMLSEIRFALEWARAEGVAEMATLDGAAALDLDDRVGRLEEGLRADITVFGRVGPDPYGAVADSRAEDVRLVLIDGVAYYGDLALEAATAVNGECDVLDACGTPKFLCVRNTPGAPERAEETLGDVRQQLIDILEGNGYPAEEQYGRGDELLELVQCR